MFLAEIDLLQVPALLQIPEMETPAILRPEQDLRHETVLEGVGCAPLAGDQRVVTEMPPAVIGKLLRAPVDLPAAEGLEGLVIHDEDAAGRLAFRVAESRNIDAVRPA